MSVTDGDSNIRSHQHLMDNLTAAIDDQNVEQLNYLLKNHQNAIEPLDHVIPAIENDSVEVVRCFLAHYPGCLMARDEGRRTLLHHAASSGSVEMVRLIVRQGSPLNITDAHQNTALHHAVRINAIHVATYLILEGISVNRARNKDGQLVIHTAVLENKLEMLKLIVDKGHTNLNVPCLGHNEETAGQTSLYIAALMEQYEMIQYLLDAGANIDTQNTKGDTILHVACRKGNTRLVYYLLDRTASCEIFNKAGMTVLHDAALSHRSEIVMILVSHGCDVDCLTVSCSMTALHHASIFGYTEIARILIENGANVNLQEGNGKQSPCIIATAGSHDITIATLLRAGADPNIADIQGSIPLHIVHNISANKFGVRAKIVQLLIEHGGDLNAVDLPGFTPIDKCVGQIMRRNYDPHILGLLVHAGAQLRQSDARREKSPSANSSLCWLVWRNKLKSAQFLIESGWQLKEERWLFAKYRILQAVQQNQFIEAVQNLLKSPVRLQHSCRTVIRTKLGQCSKGRNIVPKVDMLNLPHALKRYLNLEYELSVLNEDDEEWTFDNFERILA